MEGESAASVYSEAKGEYTKQLTLFLVPVFHRFFMGCLQQAASEEPQAKRQLWKFQELLSQVPEWNMDKVQRETSRLQSEIQCDYLEELVTAVFIAHTKVLTAIRIGNKNKRVQITIPKLDHFLHRSLCECSRLLWTSAYLFHNELSPIEKQKNHRQIEQLLHEGVAQAIRGLLPVKNILKDYLAEPEAAEDEDEEDEEKEEKKEKKEKKQEEPKEKEPEVEQPVTKEEVKDEALPVVTQESEAATGAEANSVGEVALESIVIEEAAPAPAPAAPLPAPEPATEPFVIKEAAPEVPATSAPTTPTTPTLVVETRPSVQFTDFNQVIREQGPTTSIQYEHTTHEPPPEEEDLQFMDDEGEPLSDFEILEDSPAQALGADDFETIP